MQASFTYSVCLFTLIFISGFSIGDAHTATPDQIMKIKPDIEECARITNFDQNEVHKIMIGEDPTWSNELDRFLACVLKRIGMMNADGSVNYRPGDSDVAKKCKDRRGRDERDTAAMVLACLDRNKMLIF